jgi:hypothetical protein
MVALGDTGNAVYVSFAGSQAETACETLNNANWSDITTNIVQYTPALHIWCNGLVGNGTTYSVESNSQGNGEAICSQLQSIY